MRRAIVSLAALALAGCAATSPPPPKAITVAKPIAVVAPEPVKCEVKVDPEPVYPDSDQAIAAAPDLTALAKMYRAGRALRSARIAYLTALLNQCVG